MPRIPVTAIIPAGNEAHQIEEAIRSVLWADEILVIVDAASTDGTAERAAAADPRVIVKIHEYGYSAAQKNWAIPQASHPYVFLLDADERVPDDLREEILALLQAPPEHDAYWIYRRNHFLGHLMKHGGWQTDKVIRLFRRECRYEDLRVHAEITGYRSVGFLKSCLQHDTFRDWNQYLAKLHRYTTWAAEQDFLDGKRAGFGKVVFRPWGRFIKQYWIRLGFLDGIPGAVAAFIGTYGVFLKYAKVWDLFRKNPSGPASKPSPLP
jgi:glycosyltransferase involved in cell wall biosynthesis